MPKMKYTVYNTEIRKYLKRATQPLGCEVSAPKGLRASTPAVPPETRGPVTAEDAGREVLVTEWTRRVENAQDFPGKKSAEAMVRKLGGYSELVVKNGKGEIIA